MKQKFENIISYTVAHARYVLGVYHSYSPAVQHYIIIGSLFVFLFGTTYVGQKTGLTRNIVDFTQSLFQTAENPTGVSPVDLGVIDVEVSNPADPNPQTGPATDSGASSGGGTTGTGSTAKNPKTPNSSRSTGGSARSSGGSSGSSGPNTGGVGDLHTPPLALFSSQCLKRSGRVVAVSGPRTAWYSPNSTPNTIYNATTATWNGLDSYGRTIKWTVVINGSGPACWYGGRYQGIWDDTSPDVTWEDPYHHSGAMTIRVGNFLVEGYRADNQGDGIRMEGGGANFHIRGVYMSNIHDDCVENDYLHSGVTEDSLFDGCYSGFSGDDYTGKRSGTNNIWTIRNNLIRMKPYPTVHRVSYFTDRGCSLPNHMHVFKGWWKVDVGPRVAFKNNIIKFDIRPCDTIPLFPKGVNLVECSNNIIVYTGPGNFNQAVPPCVTVTKDVTVWNNAVNQWKQTHPDVK